MTGIYYNPVAPFYKYYLIFIWRAILPTMIFFSRLGTSPYKEIWFPREATTRIQPRTGRGTRVKFLVFFGSIYNIIHIFTYINILVVRKKIFFTPLKRKK